VSYIDIFRGENHALRLPRHVRQLDPSMNSKFLSHNALPPTIGNHRLEIGFLQKCVPPEDKKNLSCASDTK
jgi:hypothetical protein